MKDLPQLRKELDAIDQELITLLTKRFAVTNLVGHYKKTHGLHPVDEGREAAQMERIRIIAKDTGLNPEFAAKFLRIIIDEVVENHIAIQNS